MPFPQTGIFALGDASHLYLEFSLLPGVLPRHFVETAASFFASARTIGGANLVIGFRPELWRAVAPSDTPDDASGFNAPIAGADGFTMPATQLDLWLWVSAASYDIVWDSGRAALEQTGDVARLERQLGGWTYRRNRDLTGFEDGTENPPLALAHNDALVPENRKGTAASHLLFQKWRHETSWHELTDYEQEHAMGRTKADSNEFEGVDARPDSHVHRAKDLVEGEERDIFRRNVAYGDIVDYGTVFVGFSAERSRLQRMLERMAGAEDGIRDAITRFTTPLTGAYYIVPAVTALEQFT
jgi:putative iron-dependent peroxidase